MAGGGESLLRRAFARARADLRLESGLRIVILVLAAAATIGIVWLATGNIAWSTLAGVAAPFLIFGFVFAYRIYTTAIEMIEERDAEISQRDTLIVERDAELAAVKAAALQADPDGIFQNGRRVGTVNGAETRLNRSLVLFAHIDGTPDFDTAMPFRYRDLDLMVESAGPSLFLGAGLNRLSAGLNRVTCRVLV